MIYYFSGTGNSLQAAKDIAAGQGEKLCSIPPKLMYEEDGFEHTMPPVKSWDLFFRSTRGGDRR